MKKIESLHCETDDILIGWFNPDTEEWNSLEGDDADDQIETLLKRKDSREIVVRSILDFALSLREAINRDNLDIFNRIEEK